jgi:iron-sulfur cluster repair protein YtfE (RIC family)
MMSVDFTMMYVAHDAFTRDLRRLSDACERGEETTPPVLAGWEMFKKQLSIHHTAEDVALWPALREKVTFPEESAVLDEMEIEHAQLEPLLERLDKALAAHDTTTALETAQVLAEALTGHMRHEENQALPLVDAHLGERGWQAFGRYFRKTQGLSGGAEFFPWLLDSAPEPTRTHVLSMFPPPVRLLYRRVWAPRYQRTSRW